MLILHESMDEEAHAVSKALQNAYGIDGRIEAVSLDGVFTEIPELDAYWSSPVDVASAVGKFNVNAGEDKKIAALILTPRDLYIGNCKDDDWILGYNYEDISVVSAARMKRGDSKKDSLIQVDKKLYLNRLSTLGVHEVGHDIVGTSHMKLATWVNVQSGHELRLGPHCTDNSCIMYEFVDIKAPSPSEGHMRLGEEKKFDAGLDDLIKRLRPNWLCDDCRGSLKISAGYK